MRIGLRESIEMKKEDNRLFRRNIVILVIVIIAVFLVFMNAYVTFTFRPPGETSWR